MVNHNTEADFAAQLADEADVSRASVLRLATYVDHDFVRASPEPMALSPQEDGIAI